MSIVGPYNGIPLRTSATTGPDKHAVLFWYLVKSGASVRYCTVAYTEHVTFYQRPETHVHV